LCTAGRRGLVCFFLEFGIEDCVEKFYIIIRECFDRFVPFEYFQGVYVNDNSQEDFVVEGDVVPWFR
jgi:hypothetical protein